MVNVLIFNRVVSNIWSSVEIEDKLFHASIYKKILCNLKRN